MQLEAHQFSYENSHFHLSILSSLFDAIQNIYSTCPSELLMAKMTLWGTGNHINADNLIILHQKVSPSKDDEVCNDNVRLEALNEYINQYCAKPSESYQCIIGLSGCGKSILMHSLKTLALSQFSWCITVLSSWKTYGSSALEEFPQYFKMRSPLSSLIPLMLWSPIYFAPTANALALDHNSGLHGSSWTDALDETQKDLLSVSISYRLSEKSLSLICK